MLQSGMNSINTCIVVMVIVLGPPAVFALAWILGKWNGKMLAEKMLQQALDEQKCNRKMLAEKMLQQAFDEQQCNRKMLAEQMLQQALDEQHERNLITKKTTTMNSAFKR